MQTSAKNQTGLGTLRARLGVVTLAAAVLVAAARTSSGAVDDPIDATRATIEKWVETRRLISQEKRDWAEGKAVLASRIELVQKELEDWPVKIEEASTSIAKAGKKRETLVEENAQVQDATRALGETIAALETRVKALLPRLPAPLRERVKLLSQRIPEDVASTKSSLSERFQNVVGILNDVDKFNREITVALEVRQGADGSSLEVSTLYLGISQAYYASADGAVAGYGAASSDGWAWTAAPDAAPAILAALAIHRNEQPAAFVRLPLTL